MKKKNVKSIVGICLLVQSVSFLILFFMFWKKKKDNAVEDEEISEMTEEDVELEATEDGVDDLDGTEEANEAEDDDKTTDVQVCFKISDLNQLATFANKRGNGTMQFMTKKTHEVFELRDAHFRIAQVWGTVTMVRECSPDEYARVMMAIELRDNPDDFYMLPGLTEAEVKQAIEDFCEDKFSVNGKKYSKKPERFTKLLAENDMREEWDEYTRALVYDKLEAFCDEKGIVFDFDAEITEEEKGEDGSDS